VNITDKEGRTPLLAAAEGGNVEIINALLVEGLDPSRSDKRGETPLHAAIREGRTDAAIVLLENGADPNIANAEGGTPIYYAAVFKADAEVFQALLNRGIDPDTRDEGGRTILDIVVMVGSADGVKETLIAHGATRPARKPFFELWLAAFVLSVLPLPYYLFYTVQHRYYKKKEKDGDSYFEVRRRDGILRRTIQALADAPPVRETMRGQTTFKETSDLITCGTREFRRYWKRRNMAHWLLHLHVRLSVLALLFCTLGFVVSAEEQARSYEHSSPFFSFFEFLEHFFYNPGEWLIGIIIGGPLVAGVLELIVLLILQFARPSRRARVVAIVIGTVAGVISIGYGLYYFAFALSLAG
jgi:hypothetical protein